MLIFHTKKDKIDIRDIVVYCFFKFALKCRLMFFQFGFDSCSRVNILEWSVSGSVRVSGSQICSKFMA